MRFILGLVLILLTLLDFSSVCRAATLDFDETCAINIASDCAHSEAHHDPSNPHRSEDDHCHFGHTHVAVILTVQILTQQIVLTKTMPFLTFDTLSPSSFLSEITRPPIFS